MIDKLHITGFRSFKDVTVDGLGRVNLITGRNNVGKSTLLEATRLCATSGSVTTLLSILASREEIILPHNGRDELIGDRNSLASFNKLFCGYPPLAQHDRSFSVVAENKGHVRGLMVSIEWQGIRSEGQPELKLGESDDSRFSVRPSVPILKIKSPERQQMILLDYAWRLRRAEEQQTNLEFEAPCLFLDPFSSRSTNQLAVLWDEIALTDRADIVIQALQIISKDIQAVTMIGGESTQRARTAMARSRQHDQPVPLKSFGDGINRVFGLILSLTCAKGGYLLIDEIENGLHYSIQADAFRAIFKLARDLNVQVFATTHSRDCIEAFQKAAAESPEDGVLVRLTRKDDKIFSTVFPEERLQVVTENQIEVR